MYRPAGLPVSLRDSLTRHRPFAKRWLLSVNVDLLRNILLLLFLLRWTKKAFYQLRGRGISGTVTQTIREIRRYLYATLFSVPGIRSRIRQGVSQSLMKIEEKLVPSGPGVTRYRELPATGWTSDKVLAELDSLANMDHSRWEDGKVSGTVYHASQELVQLQTEAYKRFAVSNPIHPDVFPGVRKMEAEIVAMVLSLYNAPEGAAGVVTSGGSESLLMACLAARHKAYAERGVTEPEMILPETAHSAFLKAGDYFKIRIRLVECRGPSYKVHIPSVNKLINPNTILLVGSAPNFPHGIIDDITALSRLALRKNIPLHVDCCLGSFLMPFLARAGFDAEPFDFRVPGVSSISCDTHKYGFAPKGSSTLLYRSSALRAYQYFVAPEWTGGVYASPGLPGSRPGALIAGCWASLMAQGENGYLSACHLIVGAAKRLESAIRQEPGLATDLCVLGRPLVSVVAFTATALSPVDIYDLADTMAHRGWHLNALQNPSAVHVAVTMPLAAALDQLIADLKSVVQELKEGDGQAVNADNVERSGRASNGKRAKKKGDAAALYGVAGSLPDKSVVVDLAKGYLDTLYKA